MYTPEAFEETRIDAIAALIRQHPLGLLISGGAAGLMSSPVPFRLYPDEGPAGLLRAHLARANPQWRALAEAPDCLVVFQGAQAYVTPSWYPAKREHGRVVPTWNYMVVEASGRASLRHEPAWLRRQIDDLTAAREAARPEPWAVEDAPAPFIAAQLRGIVGVEVALERLSGKWKLSQNRPEADRSGVVRGLVAEGATEMARHVAARSPG